MATDFEHGGLKWVIGEIFESLKQARIHLESFVEDEEDTTQLQFCTTYLHQVAGTLNMLELGGGALLAEEMETLSQAIYDDKISRREDSFEVLMRALIQLPDYLERLERGARDLPMVLLPLLNDLRASRGEKLLTEGAVFSADLSLDKITPEPDNGIDPGQLAKKIRHHYHLGLLGWYRDTDSIASINKVKKVISKIKESLKTADFYQLFSLLEAFIEGLMDKGIDSSASTKLLLGQADRYIKQLIDSGESTDSYTDTDRQNLLSLKKNLLFYIAHCENPDAGNGPAVEAIKSSYDLAGIIPDQNELDDARASMGGANSELMQAVSGVIAADLATVKEQLDVYVRNNNEAADGTFEQVDELNSIVATMSQISDTLAMLGQNGPRNVMQEKIDWLKSKIEGEQEPEREALMDVASALLYVESSLLKMGSGGLFSGANDDEVVDLSKMQLSDQEKDELLKTSVNESKAELLKVKEAIVSLLDNFSDGTKNSEQENEKLISSVYSSLLNIGGVLEIMGKAEGSQIAKDCADYVLNSLIVDSALAPQEEQQLLADTITATEYYLDAMAEKQRDLSIIESVAKSGIDQLLGRESEQPVFESDLSAALISWMSDVSDVTARENLLKVVASVAEQVKLLQHDKAEEIAHQIESTIDLVGDNQNSLSDDISSTLRWATETINRIIHNATESREADLAGSEKKNIEQTESIDDEPPYPAQPEPEPEDISATAEPVSLENDPAAEYPDIKKLEASEDIDLEIMEIFVEEAQEETEKITSLFSQWQSDPSNQDVISEMRRSFHTLKGSGRLVGAYEMGEFAWAYENLLNHFIDNSIPANELLFTTIGSGIEMLPEMINAYEQQRLSNVDSSRLAAYAHILSKGEEFDINFLLADTQTSESSQAAEDGIDPVLLEIFTNEALGHIKIVEECIEQCHLHNDVCSVDDSLLRSLHTLRGSAHMSNIHSIGNVCEKMEKAVKTVAEKGQKLDPEFVLLLGDICVFCAEALKQLNESPVIPEENLELQNRIAEKHEQIKHLENLLDASSISEDISISEEKLVQDEDSAAVHEEKHDELMEIFIDEGEELLGSSERALHKLKDNTDDTDAFKQLLRDMHTLKGGARMAGVTPIGDLTHSFESKLEQFTQSGAVLSSAHIDLLLHVQDTLSSMVDSLKNGQAIENNPELIAQIDSLSEASESTDAESSEPAAEEEVHIAETPVTEEGPLDDYDDDLLGIFLEEAQELMDSSDVALSQLKNEPGNSEQLKQLLRDLHTIKGGARMAGISPIGDLTHSIETQLEKITDSEQTPEPQFFDLLHHAHDAVNEMLDHLKAGKPIQSASKLIEQAEAFGRGEAIQLSASDVPADEKAKAIAEKKSAQEPSVQEDEQVVPEDMPEPTLPGTEAPEVRAPKGRLETTERIRVSADLLDELVNYAGEVSIYRSRLDQGSNEVQQILVEMNTTIIRMREQLRRFEMETEAQIQSRRDQAESLGYERYEEFDPLEFDRFSTMQQITRAMAETVGDLDSIENTMSNLNSESETLLIQQGRVNTDLQEGLMRTRMVPFKSQLPRLRRIVRQTAKELDKQVKFELYGEEHEIDRRVLDKIMAPLEHMLRNAVSHGIESTEEREQAGKDRTGIIKLIIARDGSEIAIKVIDDGAGIDIKAVRKKAIEHGLMIKGANLTDRDIMQFIIEAGFSTATEVSQISGRGVGMDVVNNEIKQLNGTLDISSEFGKGSSFNIHMPLTMSVSRALMVQVGEEIFAIPLVGIENIIRESNDVLEQLIASDETFYQWHDEQYQFMHLGSALGLNRPVLPGEKNKAPILLARSGEHRVALFVDALMGSREIVVKSVGPQLSSVKGVTGATILGDGKIALILDLGVLAREGAAMKGAAEFDAEVEVKDDKVTTIMVVDDSITVRKVTQRLLQRHNYNVITAKDGVDAIAVLYETIPDVMLLDVEMPRMDGFELATHMRDDEKFKDIPIIMITSRTGDKHRERAMKIGVNEYMGKPFQEHDLIANIEKMTEV